ncbi:hypothetical protein [Geobacter argillaceus]|uniref:hypothetical protein n=1 Tax=Geobacter argillaceus TaxID=345631 RepID=UPI0011A6DA33|nr:hypothetical protein [Geobacter argillaceus]
MTCLLLVLLAACGGGGAGGGGDKTTLKGMVEFPAATVAKSVDKMVEATDVTVEAYDLNGNKLTSVKPQYDDTLSVKKYQFEIKDLPTGVDYILKAKKGSQVVKKIVAKDDVKPGVVEAQNVNTVSTAAVVVAEQKLKAVAGPGFKLGETALPAKVSVDTISSRLSTDVKPAALEYKIQTLTLGNLSAIDSADKADLVNLFNMVDAAVKRNVDASSFVNGELTSVTINIVVVVVTDRVAAQGTRTIDSTAAATTATTAATSYTPPAISGGTSAAVDFVGLAKLYMEKQDVANASINYEKALLVDPNNKDAIFGAGITRVIMLTEKPEVRDVITKWGGVAPTANGLISRTSPVGNPFKNYTGLLRKTSGSTTLKSAAMTSEDASRTTAVEVVSAFTELMDRLPKQKAPTKANPKVVTSVPATATSISDLQTVIDNVIIPELKGSLALLAKLEGQSYTFTVTKAMQGNPTYGKDVIITDGEIYAIEALTNGALALLKISTAYNLDVFDYDGNGVRNDYDKLKQDPLKTINQSTFFTLKSDGNAKMTAALDYVKAARDKAEAAYAAVKTRSAGQGAIDLSHWSTTDHTNATDVLAKIKSALTGPPLTITIGNGKQLTFDATKFFTNPLDRSDFPALGYDVAPDATLSATYGKAVAAVRDSTRYVWNGTTSVSTQIKVPVDSNIQPTSDLPDYTLNGILPNNTAANNVAGFNGILPMLGGAVLTGKTGDYYWNVVTDGTSIYATAYQGGGGYDIMKIDPATGVVTTFATGGTNSYIYGLIRYNNGFYVLRPESQSTTTAPNTYTTYLKLYPVTISNSTYSVSSTPAGSLALPANSWVNSAVGDGTDIYYLSGTWSNGAYQSEVHKWSNLTTDTKLFSTTERSHFLGFWNNYLYLNKSKYDMQGKITFTAGNVNPGVIVNGYFYEISDGKLLKYAGKPDGTAAKLLSNFF